MTRGSVRICMIAATLVALLSFGTAARSAGVETLVFVRHGEKPDQELGQLSCRGLNRALALPAVIAKMFGWPDAIFAPDPSAKKNDHGVVYDYVRPLATIEPTAIFFGLPVHASIGVSDDKGLSAAVEQPAYQNAFVLVAWEHKDVVALARELVEAHGGNGADIPKWKGDDFDSIYVIKISRNGTATGATFSRAQEGLDGQPDSCLR